MYDGLPARRERVDPVRVEIPEEQHDLDAMGIPKNAREEKRRVRTARTPEDEQMARLYRQVVLNEPVEGTSELVQISNGSLGLVIIPQQGFAIAASGGVAVVGLPGLQVAGKLQVLYNTTSSPQTNPSGTPASIPSRRGRGEDRGQDSRACGGKPRP